MGTLDLGLKNRSNSLSRWILQALPKPNPKYVGALSTLDVKLKEGPGTALA